MNETKLTVLNVPPQSNNLLEHENAYRDCRRCFLGEHSDAQKHVFYRGYISNLGDGVDILFIGEGPGNHEAETGIPFVGASGIRLNMWIRVATNRTKRFAWGVTNVVACRPTQTIKKRTANRKPTHQEIDACRPRLRDLIDVVKPRTFISVGNVAKSRISEISSWAGNTIPDYHIVHPSYVIRQLPYRSTVLTKDCQTAIDTIIVAAIWGREARMDDLGITAQDVHDTMPPKAGDV